jgi:hypothetical protein
MNVTRDVIIDLWAVYAAGEASSDTRAVVDAFLKQDPEFARLLQDAGAGDLRQPCAVGPSPDGEARALRRTKRLLHGWDWLFFPALFFSCFAFGRIVSDTSWDVSPMNFIVTATIAAAFRVAFIARVIWVRRKAYRVTVSGQRLRP